MINFRFSYSQLSTYLMCGERYRQRYVEGKRRPPSTAMLRGSGQHAGQEVDLGTKLATGELPPVDHSTDAAAENVKARIAEEGVLFSEDEQLEAPSRVKGRTIDQAVSAAETYHTVVAPAVAPLHLEKRLTIEVPGMRREVVLYPDVIEQNYAIRDTKTKLKSPGKDDAVRSEQLALYSLGVRLEFGVQSPVQQLDHVVLLKRANKVVPQPVRNDATDEARIANKMIQATAAIDAGVFPPAPDGAWWCTRKWCDYYTECPYVRGGAIVSVPGIYEADEEQPDE